MKASTSRRWLALALVGGVVGAMSLSPVLAGPNDPATKKFVRKVAKKVATKKANQAVAPLLAPKTGQYSIDPHEFFARFNSDGLVHKDGGTPFGACHLASGGISAPVHLPQGAKVTKVTVYWHDADGGSDIAVMLTQRKHSDNSSSDLATVASSGSGGDGSGVTTLATPATIDNATYSYEVWGISDSDRCIRSVVIEYTA